jgi:hypothetical protein
LDNLFRMGQVTREGHGRYVDRRHLGRKHGLELIPRFNTLDD